MAKDKLVLVTGANGFIGSHLTEALLERGYRVRCLVRRSSDLTFIQDLPLEVLYGDLRQEDALRQACQGVDKICHCAALTRALDEETFFRVNTQGALALAQAALEAAPDLDRFLFVSSQAVLGPSHGADDLRDESCTPRPITWYGKSKWAAEQGLQALSDRLPLAIVRPAAVFGPRDRDFLAYFKLLKWNLSLRLGEPGRQISLIYIGDLIDLFLYALEENAALGQTYVGSAFRVSHEQLAQEIAHVMNKRPLVVALPEAALTPLAWGAKVQARLSRRPPLLNDQRLLDLRQPYWLCSGEKARRELGFSPRYDLETALRETAGWYREQGWL